jgi:hypothetical protein
LTNNINIVILYLASRKGKKFIMKKFKVEQNGNTYEAVEGGRTVSVYNPAVGDVAVTCFTTGRDIDSYKTLRDEVVSWIGIGKLHDRVPQILEQNNLDSLIKTSVHQFVENVEMHDLSFDELAVLANIQQVFLKNSKISFETGKYSFKTSLDGKRIFK